MRAPTRYVATAGVVGLVVALVTGIGGPYRVTVAGVGPEAAPDEVHVVWRPALFGRQLVKRQVESEFGGSGRMVTVVEHPLWIAGLMASLTLIFVPAVLGRGRRQSGASRVVGRWRRPDSEHG